MKGQRIVSEATEVYRTVGGSTGAGIVLLCDHASNELPENYGTLGLATAEFQRHIAYDIGAAAVAERLAQALDAPAVLSRVSRLLIDLNRGEDDPTLIMRLSDGAVIPGNANLTPAERAYRVQRFYRPYHASASAVVGACRAGGRRPIVFSVHSMTNVWKSVARPWHVSILSNDDRRLADVLINGFKCDGRLIVGDNEPYHGGLEGDTLWQHARPHGLAHAVIEYRQDLVADARGQDHWAEVTAAILQRCLAHVHEWSSP